MLSVSFTHAHTRTRARAGHTGMNCSNSARSGTGLASEYLNAPPLCLVSHHNRDKDRVKASQEIEGGHTELPPPPPAALLGAPGLFMVNDTPFFFAGAFCAIFHQHLPVLMLMLMVRCGRRRVYPQESIIGFDIPGFPFAAARVGTVVPKDRQIGPGRGICAERTAERDKEAIVACYSLVNGQCIG